jgi:hypothetical protein
MRFTARVQGDGMMFKRIFMKIRSDTNGGRTLGSQAGKAAAAQRLPVNSKGAAAAAGQSESAKSTARSYDANRDASGV